MNLPLGSSTRLVFLAGQERGIRISYMARAKVTIGGLRRAMVLQARYSNHEMVRYLRAAKEAP